MSRSGVLAIVLGLAAAAAVVVWVSDTSRDDAPAASVLHRGLLTDPESVDPHKARSTQAGDVLRDIGEGLLSYSATGDLVAGVADQWSVSDDGLTYTFHIRDDARWSNGDAVTAGQFVFSLRRLVDPATAAFYSQMIGDIVNANEIIAGKLPATELGIAAPDDLTLIITLVRPTPYLLSLLTFPATFPVHPGSIATHGAEFTRAGNLLSNGAYKLDAWEPGSVLALSRNEYYWNNAATAIDEVRHHVVTQEMLELNRYGSLLPGMIVHFLNNGIVILLSILDAESALAEMSPSRHMGLLAGSVALVAAGIWITSRARRFASSQM